VPAMSAASISALEDQSRGKIDNGGNRDNGTAGPAEINRWDGCRNAIGAN